MTESLREFLDRRERELLSELVPTEATVAAIKAELVEIRHARDGLGAIPTYSGLLAPSSSLLAPSSGLLAPGSGPLAPTIKELVVNALATSPQFRRYGATTAELKECLKHMFDRDVEVSSLSPQLSRLRDEGALTLVEGRWKRRRTLLTGDNSP